MPAAEDIRPPKNRPDIEPGGRSNVGGAVPSGDGYAFPIYPNRHWDSASRIDSAVIISYYILRGRNRARRDALLKFGPNGTLMGRVAGLGDHFAHLESNTEACVVAAALIRRDELPLHYVSLPPVGGLSRLRLGCRLTTFGSKNAAGN